MSGSLWVLLVLLVAATGCTRAFWRNQADCCVYTAVNTSAQDPQWPMRDFTINISPKSRLFDPTNPDRPPMPPDDPTLHQFMHCVNCMHGFPCWHQNGDNPFIANPLWQQFLPIDAEGNVVVDSTAAVELGLLNSREYQFQLEQLYLSALDVTFERFRFVTQVFADNSTFYTADGRLRSGSGGVPSSVLDTDNTITAQRLFGAGGTLVADVANSFMWQFAGPNSDATNTLIDFTFIQPLLQFAGRARTMERLTLAERVMVANVRTMQRYRQGFYVATYTGRGLPSGPIRLGGAFGGAGLQGFSGVGLSGFGRVGGVGETGGVGGGGGGAGAAQAGGYLGIVQDMQQIENQEANVAGLRDSTAQMEAAYDAGRIDRFQVDFSRQAMYNAESILLTSRAALETSLDSFKVGLGLPPDTPLKVEDPVLDQFRLIDLRLTALQNDIGDLLDLLRANTPPATKETLEDYLRQVDGARERAAGHIGLVERDFDTLDQNYQPRIRELEALAERARAQQGDVDPSAFSSEIFKDRVATVKEDFASLVKRFDTTATAISQVQPAEDSVDVETTRLRLVDLATELSGQMAELSLVQARVKLDSVMLAEINLDPRDAFTIARDQRPDLRNGRSSLVDQWRLIEFNANALEAGLDLVFSGDMGTARNNPVSFRDATGRLRVGVRFDAPLTRIEERNIYRQTLIDYQQRRRAYMLAEDSIYQNLRLELRTIELNKLNFELRRGAVFIAIDQVDLTRLRLTQPPRPGETSLLGNTTARDLVDSLSQLLNVQNQFLSVWVNQEVQRRNLDFDLGTLQLDSRGIWIDPGPITGEAYLRRWRMCQAKAAAEPKSTEEILLETIPPPADREELPLPGDAPDRSTQMWDDDQSRSADADHGGMPREGKKREDEIDWGSPRSADPITPSPARGSIDREEDSTPAEQAPIRLTLTPPANRISTAPRWRNP